MKEKSAKRILVIEDETSLREALRRKFESQGFQVSLAGDGEEGLQRALDERPNLILLDVMMPRVDGFSALQLIKDNENLKDIPVILLTNLGQAEDKKRGLALGAVEYLIKADNSLVDIVNVVNKYL